MSNATQFPNRNDLNMSMGNRPDFTNNSGFAGPGGQMGEDSLLEGSDSGFPQGFMNVESADALIVNVSYTDLFGNRKSVQKEVNQELEQIQFHHLGLLEFAALLLIKHQE